MALQSAIINVMKQAARKASVRLKRDYGEVDQLQVSQKGPSDFVTAADIRTERILKEELTRARPNFGFLMEEAGEIKGHNSNCRWIVDPIDGTTSKQCRSIEVQPQDPVLLRLGSHLVECGPAIVVDAQCPPHQQLIRK